MPAGISNLAPSSVANSYDFGIGEDLPAFTILHKDTLEMTLPMLHLNHSNGGSRENTMNNLTRTESKNEKSPCNVKTDLCNKKRISRSNDHLIMASLQNHQTNPLRKKRHTKSHENIGENEKISTDETIKNNNNVKNANNNNQNRHTPMTLSTENFNDVLNAKLKKIGDRDDDEANKRGCKKNPNGLKKPFITTVKTGEFLMPPPEVAALLGMAPNGDWIGVLGDNHDATETDGLPVPRSRFRPLVSLGRRPEVRHCSHNARCQAAALKATVDFGSSLANVGTSGCTNTAATTTTVGPTFGRDGRLRRSNDRFANAETDKPLPFGNIMFDRRVIRGSTFASAPLLMDDEQSQAARQAEAKRRQIARKRAQCQATRSLMMRIGSPPPVPGRKHEPVQTELYLEELYDKPDESEVATQTDYFLDRPATPLYCPGKVGQDAETQIAPGDLFDYDVEVQPILEVLVGKTIEQALIEVLEEEELAALREQQRRFLELRAAEKAEQQRLEEQDRRLREEKCRRKKQHEEALKTQKETEERVAASVLLTGYIAELLPAVLEGLKMSGFLLDEIKADVQEGFMPWLMTEVKKEMGSMIESRELLMEIIREILENRAQTYTRLAMDYDETSPREKSGNKSGSECDDAIPTNEGGEEPRDVDFVDYEPPVVDDEPDLS